MNIVIVDDVPTNALLLAACVQTIPDVECFSFTDPAEALDWCSANQPDLIFIDYLMPRINGIEFIRGLSALAKAEHVPIVMVTGMEDREMLINALEAGATDFLRKPVDQAEVAARAKSMLKLRSGALKLLSANQELHRLATTDALTETFNRRHFMDMGTSEYARARRYGTPLSLVMLDADHFKKVNDTYGHDVGDEVLRVLSKLCQQGLRQMDFVGRLGGEEFALCLPQTDMTGAVLVAERLRTSVAACEVGRQKLKFTVSLGVAQLTLEDEELSGLIKRADQALYTAKSTGRNKVVTTEATSVTPAP